MFLFDIGMSYSHPRQISWWNGHSVATQSLQQLDQREKPITDQLQQPDNWTRTVTDQLQQLENWKGPIADQLQQQS